MVWWMKNNYKKIAVLNIVIPLIVGAIIYYLLSPNVIFVDVVNRIIGEGWHYPSLVKKYFIIRYIRFYFLDMLWGYSLVFTLHYFFDNNTANLKKIFIIAFIFSVLMEVLQVTSLTNGTFDLLDILHEFIAEVFAVFIIKNLFMRRDKNEKEN